MPIYHDCAAIGAPGWEATAGQFYVHPHSGRLRFLRTIRRQVAGSLPYTLCDDTPRSLDRRIAAFGRKLAELAR